MERLSDKAIEIINELRTERLDYNSEYNPLIDAANALAAYEDTGYTPEEIDRLTGELERELERNVELGTLYLKYQQLLKNAKAELSRYRERGEAISAPDSDEPYELSVYKRLGLTSQKAKQLVEERETMIKERDAAKEWRDYYFAIQRAYSKVEAERDAAIDCINDLESYLVVMEGATEYVKPNTGIWHTVCIAIDRVKKWRGLTDITAEEG